MTANTIRIDFEPVGKRVEVEVGCTLMDAAILAGIELVAICGGMGTCNRCAVQDTNGICIPAGEQESSCFSPSDLKHGFRLACMAIPERSGRIHIPPVSLTTPQRLQVEGCEGPAIQPSAFRVLDLCLEEPSLEDPRADTSRLMDALAAQLDTNLKVRYGIMIDLPGVLRANKWNVRAVCRGDEVVGILPKGQKPLCLAVDTGTTKIAAYLMDLENGAVLAWSSAMNPQIHFGEDVISRIAYCMEHPDGRQILQSHLVETLNSLTAEMCAEQHVLVEQIVEAVVVGNTVMHHLLAGLPVKQLGLSPFVPVVNEPLEIQAEAIGLRLGPGASLVLPAIIAGYVGADHTAMLLASEAYQAADTVIAIDIGTNTEVSLVHQGKIICCSCASGPAFEGAHIHEGMRAAPGAIEKVQITEDEVSFHTIGNGPPVGICGSGILDAIAEMVRNGILNERGGLNLSARGVRGTGKDAEFVLASADVTGTGRDLTINRRDIHEILLAKAAIQTGIEILLRSAGITAEQIDRFIVAGAFGTYLDIKSAVQIGMLPPIHLERFTQVGNAAGTGARWILISEEMRSIARNFVRQVKYVELTTDPNFQEIFLHSLQFPRVSRSYT